MSLILSADLSLNSLVLSHKVYHLLCKNFGSNFLGTSSTVKYCDNVRRKFYEFDC